MINTFISKVFMFRFLFRKLINILQWKDAFKLHCNVSQKSATSKTTHLHFVQCKTKVQSNFFTNQVYPLRYVCDFRCLKLYISFLEDHQASLQVTDCNFGVLRMKIYAFCWIAFSLQTQTSALKESLNLFYGFCSIPHFCRF